MTLETAMAVTVTGSVLCSLSWVLQKQAAVTLPRISARFESTTLLSFITSARWLLGVSMMGAGFLSFQMAVASTGEIAILQPMFGAGSATLAVCAVVFLHERFSRLEWLALAVLIAGLAVLGVTAEAHTPHPAAVGLVVSAAIVATMLLLAAFNSARFVQSFSPEFLLGTGGGLVQGVGLILMGTFSFYRNEPGALWSFLLIPCAAACFLASFLSMQSGVQVGRAMMVITLNTVVTNLVAIIGGIFVLGETLPTDPMRAGLEITAFAAIVVASGILARLSAPGTVGGPADAVSRQTAVARGV